MVAAVAELSPEPASRLRFVEQDSAPECHALEDTSIRALHRGWYPTGSLPGHSVACLLPLTENITSRSHAKSAHRPCAGRKSVTASATILHPRPRDSTRPAG